VSSGGSYVTCCPDCTKKVNTVFKCLNFQFNGDELAGRTQRGKEYEVATVCKYPPAAKDLLS